MKQFKRALSIVVLLMMSFGIYAQDVNVGFNTPANIVQSPSGDSLEVEIVLDASTLGTYLTDGILYINYGSGLGSDIANTIDIEFGDLLDEKYLGLAKYQLINVANNTTSKLAITFSETLLSLLNNPIALTEVHTTPKVLMRITIPIIDNTQSANISFDCGLMSSPSQFYYATSSNTTPVAYNTITCVNDLINQPLTPTVSTCPTITLTPTVSAETCSGNDGSIQVSITGGVAPYTMTSTGGSVSSVNSTTFDVTGLSAANYVIIATDNNGCADTINVNVGVTPPPSAFALNGPTSIVQGNPVQYIISPFNSNSNYSVTVSGNNTTYAVNDSAVSVIWNAIGTGYIQVTETDNSTNCSGSPQIVNVNINANPNCLATDSTALVNFYTAMNGANWYTPWILNAPVSTWAGVTLDPTGCYVIGLDLSNQGLNGVLAPLNLPYLITLDVRSNELTDIDCNFTTPNLFEVHIQNNRLNFGSNLTCFNLFPSVGVYNYAPQKCITVFDIGGTYYANAGGNVANNIYYWYLNGTTLVATITGDSTYTPAISGVYTVDVTSTTVSNLTLCSPTLVASINNNCNATTLDLGNNLTTCNSSYTITGLANMMSYSWNNGATTKDINVNTTGWYALTVTDSCSVSSTDSVYIDFNCPYAIASQQIGCNELVSNTVCASFETSQSLGTGVVGYNLCMTYDTTRLIAKPGTNNGALHLGDVFSHSGTYDESDVNYVIYAPTNSNEVNVTVYYDILGSNVSLANITGEIFCLEFDMKPNFYLGDTATFDICEIKQNYSNYFLYSDGIGGSTIIEGDTLHRGRVIYHNQANQPYGYNPANPLDIQTVDASCGTPSSSVTVDVNGYYNIPVQGSKIQFTKMINNNLPFVQVMPIINSQDRYLAEHTAAGADLGLTLFQMRALDVSNDGVVSAADAYQINQRMFTYYTEFIDAQNNPVPDVVFVDNYTAATYTSFGYNSVPVFPSCLSIPSNTSGICTTYDSLLIHAVIMGDGDMSWNNSWSGWESSSNHVDVELDSIIIDENSCEILIPIYVSGTITALDIYADIDLTSLSILDVLPASPMADSMVISHTMMNNTLIISSYSSAIDGIQTNEPLYYIKVTSVNNSISTNDFTNYGTFVNGISANINIQGGFSYINNAPQAVTDVDSTLKNQTMVIDVLVNDSDIDGDNLTTSLSLNAANGNVVKLSNSTYEYTPNNEFLGWDSFEYTLCDDDSCDNKCVIGTVALDVKIPTGYEEVLEDTDISIYPNPANDHFVIDYSKYSNRLKGFDLYNANGQLVKSHTINDINYTIVDTYGLPNGVYFIKLINENYVINSKIIIKR